MKHVKPVVARQRSVIWILLGVLAEIMLTAAAVCALYIAWQMWWTGVQSEHTQIETRQAHLDFQEPSGLLRQSH